MSDRFWESTLVLVMAGLGFLVVHVLIDSAEKQAIKEQLHTECIEQGKYDKFQCHSMIYGDK